MTIAEHVWDSSYEARSNVIDVILSRVRRKLEQGSRSRLIHTIVGSGYVLRESAGERSGTRH
jgi:DNA-binding response OmpR family regulator